MRFGFSVYIQEDTLGVRLWNWYKRLIHIKANYNREPWHSFGISYSDRTLHLNWGHYTKVIWMPWEYGSNIRHEVMNEKGELVMASEQMESIARIALRKRGIKSYFDIKIPDGRKIFTDPYKYIRRNGEVQNRTATYHVEEREWRWRIFHPYKIGPKKVSRCISINFDAEVGEGSGSWKGGCTGCGYEMLPGELPQQTLCRMQLDRKFDR